MKKRILASLIVLVITIMLVTGCSGDNGDEATKTAPPVTTTQQSSSSSETARDGDTVYVHYTGTLNDGSQFDSSVGKDPLVFVLGAGNMITGFENAVRGMKVGESKTVTLAPEEAYGQHREDLLIKFGRDELPEGLDPQVGQALMLTMSNGQVVQKPVVEVTDSYIVVDANHDLAGKELTFAIELVKLEPAAENG